MRSAPNTPTAAPPAANLALPPARRIVPTGAAAAAAFAAGAAYELEDEAAWARLYSERAYAPTPTKRAYARTALYASAKRVRSIFFDADADGAVAAVAAPAPFVLGTAPPAGVSWGEAFFDGLLVGAGSTELLAHLFTYVHVPDMLKMRAVTRQLRTAIDDEAAGGRAIDHVYQQHVKHPHFVLANIVTKHGERDVKSVKNWAQAVPRIFPVGCTTFRAFIEYNNAQRYAESARELEGFNAVLLRERVRDRRTANRQAREVSELTETNTQRVLELAALEEAYELMTEENERIYKIVGKLKAQCEKLEARNSALKADHEVFVEEAEGVKIDRDRLTLVVAAERALREDYDAEAAEAAIQASQAPKEGAGAAAAAQAVADVDAALAEAGAMLDDATRTMSDEENGDAQWRGRRTRWHFHFDQGATD